MTESLALLVSLFCPVLGISAAVGVSQLLPATQWRSHVVDLLGDIDEVLAARSREVSDTSAHQSG